jgi:hypothetical protein
MTPFLDTAKKYTLDPRDEETWPTPPGLRSGPPRILRYRLKALPVLVDSLAGDGHSKMAKLLGVRWNYFLARKLCQSKLPVDGWIAESPAEIVLCEPEKFLVYEGVQERNFSPPKRRGAALFEPVWRPRNARERAAFALSQKRDRARLKKAVAQGSLYRGINPRRGR